MGGEVGGLEAGGHRVGDEGAGHEEVVGLLHLPEQHALGHAEREVGLAEVADGAGHRLLVLRVAAVGVLGEEVAVEVGAGEVAARALAVSVPGVGQDDHRGDEPLVGEPRGIDGGALRGAVGHGDSRQQPTHALVEDSREEQVADAPCGRRVVGPVDQGQLPRLQHGSAQGVEVVPPPRGRRVAVAVEFAVHLEVGHGFY